MSPRWPLHDRRPYYCGHPVDQEDVHEAHVGEVVYAQAKDSPYACEQCKSLRFTHVVDCTSMSKSPSTRYHMSVVWCAECQKVKGLRSTASPGDH